MKPAIANERGITLIAVIFMVVFLGGLGIAISRLAQTRAFSTDNELASQEAFYGAYAGLEWGMRQRVEAPLNTQFANLAGDFTAANNLPGGTSFALSYTRASDTLMSASTVRGCTRSLEITGFCCSVTNLYGYGWCCPVTCGHSSPQNLFSLAGNGNGMAANQPIFFSLPLAANAAGAGTTLAGTQTYLGVGNALPPAGSAPNYLNITGDLVLNPNARLTINGPAGTNKLTLFIGGNMTLGDSAFITVNGNVQIVVAGSLALAQNSGFLLGLNSQFLMQTGGAVTLGNNAVINSGTGNAGSALNALIMSTGDISLGTGASFQGGIYSMGNVTVGLNALLTGAIAAGGNIAVGANSVITPNPSAASQTLAAINPC